MNRDTYHHGDLKKALIQAGIEILASEGTAGLTLRKAARRAGVSHAAPYAHFADKQALIAAISTQGYCLLFEKIQSCIADYPQDPLRQLVTTAWVYVRFAVEESAHFKITFSGVVEREEDYPDLVEIAQKSYAQLKGVVVRCQEKHILGEGSPDILAVSVWSQVHGLASLLVENQISHQVLDRFPVHDLLIASLQQFVQVPVAPDILATCTYSAGGEE